jgi:hypothetical protein
VVLPNANNNMYMLHSSVKYFLPQKRKGDLHAGWLSAVGRSGRAISEVQ